MQVFWPIQAEQDVRYTMFTQIRQVGGNIRIGISFRREIRLLQPPAVRVNGNACRALVPAVPGEIWSTISVFGDLTTDEVKPFDADCPKYLNNVF